jgi:uncharacterized damage-inducible protein DinB
MFQTGRLAEENAGLLQQASAVLELVTDEQYTAPVLGGHAGTVGAQVRHVLDFATCLLRDLPAAHVEYDRRQRDRRVETDRTWARRCLEGAARQLASLGPADCPRVLFVRSDEVVAGGAPRWTQTSVERELQFLASHTIHHYAVLALMLRTLGVEVPASFGVAPSTLAYWRSQRPSAA